MNNDNFIERIVQLMETDDSADAPAGAVKWAKNVFASRAAQARPTIFETIVATLRINISPERPAFGERSATSSAVRQLLFAAGENSIDLRIAAGRSKSTISGQILGDGFEGAALTLEGTAKTHAAKSGELNEFKFKDVPNGTYRLAVRASGKEIVIEQIEVG
jgi:hypothetical protein